jgi:hypothetical protein
MQFASVTLVAVQVAPESVEVKIGPGGAEEISAASPPVTATNLLPSAEQAMEAQFVSGTLAAVQVAPESAET